MLPKCEHLINLVFENNCLRPILNIDLLKNIPMAQTNWLILSMISKTSYAREGWHGLDMCEESLMTI